MADRVTASAPGGRGGAEPPAWNDITPPDAGPPRLRTQSRPAPRSGAEPIDNPLVFSARPTRASSRRQPVSLSAAGASGGFISVFHGARTASSSSLGLIAAVSGSKRGAANGPKPFAALSPACANHFLAQAGALSLPQRLSGAGGRSAPALASARLAAAGRRGPSDEFRFRPRHQHGPCVTRSWGQLAGAGLAGRAEPGPRLDAALESPIQAEREAEIRQAQALQRK